MSYSDKNNKMRNLNSWMIVLGMVLIFVAAILIFLFLVRGQTTITGGWPEPDKAQSLMCEADGIDYPFFSYDISTEKKIKINVVFSSDQIDAISLRYILSYNNEQRAVSSEALNHIAMNDSFGKDGLGFDALGARYSIAGNSLQLSLYARGDEVNMISLPYFMLDSLGRNDIESVEQFYKNEGFRCTSSEK